MVEGAKIRGKIQGETSSRYIALIPKMGDTQSFLDYRPISLCNILYKLISKIIVEHIKKTLSNYISWEQTGFLRNRLIHDAVVITHETIHSIHTNTLEAPTMKIDLCEAYDCLDWPFRDSLY